jgi:hypothetical protein
MIRKTFASAALAAGMLAGDLVVLTLFLNPSLEPRAEILALVLSIFLPAFLAGTLGLLVVALLATLVRFWPRATRPPVEGRPWFTTLMFVACAAAAALFWQSLLGYRHSIPLDFLRGLFGSAVAITGAAAVLLAVVLDSLLFPLRSRSIPAVLAVLSPAAAIAVPLALLPRASEGPRPVPVATEVVVPTRRIRLIGIDGIGPADLRRGMDEDQLPGFARARKRGAFGALATLRPTEAPPIWTTILTGRLPRDHGVKSFVTYRLLGSPTSYELLPKGALVSLLERSGLVTTEAVTSAARRRRSLWEAMNAFGISTGLVRMWGTHPAQKARGFMLSPYFHLLADGPRAAESVAPVELLEQARARVVHPGEIDRGLVSRFLEPPAPGAPLPRPVRILLEEALAPDLTYRRAGDLLREAYDPSFFATYVYGLDVVGHSFLRFAEPDRFGNVKAAEVREYGRVLPAYRAFVDQSVGEAVQAVRPGEVLFVVSGFGMEPMPLWRRLLVGLLGGDPPSGTHAEAPDGFLLAMGDGIRPGALVENATVLDVAPTILYLAGLPVGRDMEGRVLTEIFDDDFVRGHPVTFIPSYESLAVTRPGDTAPLPPLREEDEGP